MPCIYRRTRVKKIKKKKKKKKLINASSKKSLGLVKILYNSRECHDPAAAAFPRRPLDEFCMENVPSL